MASNGQLDRVPLPGGRAARLYAHALRSAGGEPIQCWSYASEGLAADGQREIVLTVRQARGETLPPGDGIGLLEFLARAAEGGKLVDRGGVSEFGPRGFLGNPAWRGLVYAPARPLADVPFGAGTLAAIALFGDELEAVRRYGAARVLARLGKAAGYFPFPPWCERARAPLAGALESVLDGVAGLPLPDASASVEGEVVRVRLSPACAPRLAKVFGVLPADRALALHVGLAPDAQACLVWAPGQASPAAISGEGADVSRLGACFVGFVPQQDADDARLFEDGVMVRLTDATWSALRAALAAGRPFELAAAGGGRGLAIEWPAASDEGASGEYDAAPADDWRPWRPTGPSAPAEGPVGAMHVLVSTAGRELEALIERSTFGEYVRALASGVREVVGRLAASPGSDLVIEVRLAADEPPAFAFGLRSLGPASELGAQLPKRLERVPAPDVRGELRFKVLFPLWGGTGKPLGGGEQVDTAPG